MNSGEIFFGKRFGDLWCVHLPLPPLQEKRRITQLVQSVPITNRESRNEYFFGRITQLVQSGCLTSSKSEVRVLLCPRGHLRVAFFFATSQTLRRGPPLYLVFCKPRQILHWTHRTESPEQRLNKHLTDHKGFTGKAIDWQIVYTKEFPDKKSALAAERLVKSWKSRAAVERMIRGGA